jgi:ribosomal protein S18 acetylase RimI-like enzyme
MDMGAVRPTADRMGVTAVRVRAFTREDRGRALEALEALGTGGVFSEEEVRVAAGVIDDAVADPAGYVILAGDAGDNVRGFVCGGSTPLTASTWHLYWICVDPEAAGRGLGRALQSRFEESVRERGGRRVVVETSGRADYTRARHFYEAAGYREVGRIPDFYADGDSCVLYSKEL